VETGAVVSRARLLTAVLAGAVFALGVGASEARPARSDHVTISLLAQVAGEQAVSTLIPNFERAYPNVTVNPTYVSSFDQAYQLEATQLAAGTGPDVLEVLPGCGTPISVCVLAKDGYLAPLIDTRWPKRSLKLVTSASKYHQSLVVFEPSVGFLGIFTNDDLFKKLGLEVPQTFSQLLAVCQRAKADGTVAMLIAANGSIFVPLLAGQIALTTVYARDAHWGKELEEGKVTFEGTPGWHTALQEIVDMNTAGCFEPGAAGLTPPAASTAFAQGQALMYVTGTGFYGAIEAAGPAFSVSQRPFPGGEDPARTVALLNTGPGFGVNAHSSPANQAAAVEFVNFIARPEQDALYVKVGGGLSQSQLLEDRVPNYLSSFAPLIKEHDYAINPEQFWWNTDVGNALMTYSQGLLTGQETVDDVLNAMDAAWKQGPA
jgi:raffinose/stachyose/melibiose transport system substrate-binding protein